jgi:hypothetical protein
MTEEQIMILRNRINMLNKNVMKSTEEIIKERFEEMSGSDCRDFLVKSLDYCKHNFPKDWEEDEWLKSIANTIGSCINNKKLTLQQFKLINRYTNVIDVFNSLTKSWN